MKRAIVTPAVLPPSALAELKQWLGISTAHDDALLASLLKSSLAMCEAFTGIMPLEAECEEAVAPTRAWIALSARPVSAITQAMGITATGDTFALPAGAWDMEIAPDGSGHVRISAPGAAARVTVRYTAGLAATWDALPEALRHGAMRLAAHQHREREDAGASPVPPAAVAALWRPWRRVRLT